MKARSVKVKRKTKETEIEVHLNLDGKGKYRISTGIGFLDHMLELFSFHGRFDLKIGAKGDLNVDIHHTNEDLGLSLGEAINRALGDREGIRRFGFFYVPMGEALVRVVLDISGRASLFFKKPPGIRSGKEYSFLDLKHFLGSFVKPPGINLHIDVLRGEDFHHVAEAIFKALGKALRIAVELDPRGRGIPSTKGIL